MEKKGKDIFWSIIHFDDLSTSQLYDIYELRTRIFVVEQECAYQEVDEKDKLSFHVLGYSSANKLMCVARILPQEVSYKEVSFGRVAIALEMRGTGFGHRLTIKMITFIKSRFDNAAIRISAQNHLTKFYQAHGFAVVSDVYLEDDIPHIEMLRLSN